MKNTKNNYLKKSILLAIIYLINVNCTRDLSDDATLATSSKTGDIFTDTPVAMGTNFYFPYGGDANNPIGSKPTAWTVDQTVSYKGNASMRFDVPNSNDPGGNYAGGIFRVDGAGRNLSGYDALTFWAKASQGITIGEIGFGEDFYPNKYITTMSNVSLGTQWAKYTIPIPDASKLVLEKGMLRYSAGTQATNGFGYTFWIDELRFEKLGTIAHPQPSILNGANTTVQSFIGSKITLSDLKDTFNMASGNNQTVSAAPSYFTFSSSDTTVATVNEFGIVEVIKGGTCVIKASLAGVEALGSLTINSLGAFISAPTPPARNPADVISIFCDSYTNIPVQYYNGYYAPYQTTQGQADISLNGNNVIKYSQFNFVGIQFAQPTVNASQMTRFHMDIKVQNTTGPRNSVITALNDFGADGVYGGGNDTSIKYTFTSSSLPAGGWVSVDVPISSFTGASNRQHFAQIILESLATTGITDLLVDNIYLYK